MIHTLALWPGSPPSDAASACHQYSSRMIGHGIDWARSGKVPPQDPALIAFCRHAAGVLLPSAAGAVSPLRDPTEVGMLTGEVLTLEFDGPQPLALASLARLAEQHGLVLFDLHAHRVLTSAAVSTTFGAPMIPVPAAVDLVERAMRCSERWDCIDALQVLPTGLLDCSRALDPFLVTPLEEERARFEEVLDLLGCLDLEDLRERLEELIRATEDDPAW